MSWSPLLTGDLRTRAEVVIASLARAFRDAESTPEDGPDWSTLARGEVGIPLFYAYYWAATADASYAQLASDRLELALTRGSTELRSPFLMGGLAGLAWTVEHTLAMLPERGGWDGDPFEELDAGLEEILTMPDELPAEIYRGIAGIGLYALERLPRPTSVRYLERMVEVLDRSARDGAWFSRPEHLGKLDRERFPDGLYSLGVAHGTPGIIAVLAATSARGIARDRAGPLVERAVEWLWQQRLPNGAFSAYVGDPRAVRPAWCYGDLGIAAVLAAIDDDRYRARASELVRLMLEREFRLDDAPLCHGTAGLAHMLARIYHVLRDEPIADAARVWYQRAVDMYQPDRGARGFVQHDTTVAGQPVERAHVGLVDGSAGVGLALLAATTNHEPRWDRVLALSH